VPLSRRRRVAVWALIGLASLLAIVAILSTWVNRQLLDNDSFRKTSTNLIQDPAIQSALAGYLVNEAYDNVDVPAALAERLPANLKPLAPPLAAALRQPATNAVDRLLDRPRVQTLFVNASAGTHRELIAVVENKTTAATTANGDVTIDLGALVQRIGPSLGLPRAALSRLPPETGVITVMRSDQLAAVQNGVRGIRIVSTWLVVLVLALFGAAIYIAAGARREALRSVGWAFVFVGLLVLAVRRLAGNAVVDALAAPVYRDAAQHGWLIASSILGEVGRAMVLYGIVGVLGAVLAGPSRLAVATRSRLAPILNERPDITWGGAAGVYLLLVLWGATHALRTWWGILLLGGLLALGIVALRRQTLREFPEPRPKPADDATPSVGARVAGSLRPKPAAAAGSTQANDLARLAALHESGALTDAEFTRAKTLALS
jgi:uncharacterized SAM-binding protein YcdF (DUF218 family)